jgi:translation initiation factor IF-2
MANKRIRVYELARELGLSNKEALDLCERLRIGVKSHSSSIEDPQADRVRRLADAEGLRRPTQPEAEPEAPAPAASAPAPTPAPAGVSGGPSDGAGEPAAPAHRVIRSTEGGAVRMAPRPEAPSPPPPPRAPMPERVQPIQPAPSGPSEAPPAAERPAAEAPRPAAAGTPAPPAPPATGPGAGAPSRPPAPAGGGPGGPGGGAPGQGAPGGGPGGPGGPGAGAPGGRRIPPPPPRSISGKPIPPPPGAPRTGGAGGPGGPGGPRGNGGFQGRGPGGGGGPRTGGAPPRPGGGGFPSRGGPPRTGGGPGGGGFPSRGGPGGGGGGFPGRGGPGGGPGGGFPGRGRPGPQQRPRRKKKRGRGEELTPTQLPSYTPADAPVPEGEIVVPRLTTIQDLAPKLNRTPADIVRMLMMAGEMVTATQSLPDEMIELIAEELGANVILVEPGMEAELELQKLFEDDDDEDDESLLEPRAPVVTVMGHVDHGKTKLLDRIRETNVVAGEAGGITQHIGAYQTVRNGRKITFIDTPGHEAFTAMRARGAEATDIVVLVVAADDGVMPQTVEALNHAKTAEVPILVAINKIDRENADPDKVRRQLTEQELVPEEWGGDTMMIEVSALEGLGIDDLLEAILLVADVEDLRANPKAPVRGLVLEANLDPGRGPVATVLVEKGTLRVSDPIVAGHAWGRVRAMLDENGQQVTEAGPSVPVQVLGFDEVPYAGDEMRVAPDDRTARVVAESRARRRRAAGLAGRETFSHGTKLEDIFAHIQRGEVTTLNLVLKADVQGSLEALTESLRKLERDEVKLAFVHRAVGGITESDVNLANVSNATIIGFNVRPDRKAREMAEQEGVELRLYEVIYQALEDIEAAMVGMLKPEFEEVVTGEAEVREVFSVPRIGKVAGCYVRNGTITRGSKVRFLREGVVIWKGEIASLKRFKDDVREVQSGYECGIGLENYQDLKAGDVIETYAVKEIPRG